VASDDPLASAMEAARQARQAAEKEAARLRTEAERQRAERDGAEERTRQELKRIGVSFIQHAHAAGIRPEYVQVQIGMRDRFEGVFTRRKVGVQSIYERRRAWTIMPYHNGSGYSTDPDHSGIYVLDDGQIIGSMSDSKSLPHGDVTRVTQLVAEYLVAHSAPG